MDDDAQNIGPFTTEELTGFYQDGSFTDETYIWAEQCEGWETIGTMKALKEVLSAPGAPSTAAAEAADVPEAKEAFKVRAKSMSKRRASVCNISADQKTPVTLLKELSQKNYQDQATWFLNAYWAAEGKQIRFDEKPGECEKVWDMYHQMVKLDKENGKDGNELDEHKAHIFLEKTTGAITVKKMREVLREVDVDFNSMVSLTEALIYSYKIDYKYLVTAVVDDSEAKALMQAAKDAVSSATQALQDSQKAAEEAAQAALEANARAEEAAASAQKAQEDAEGKVFLFGVEKCCFFWYNIILLHFYFRFSLTFLYKLIFFHHVILFFFLFQLLPLLNNLLLTKKPVHWKKLLPPLLPEKLPTLLPMPLLLHVNLQMLLPLKRPLPVKLLKLHVFKQRLHAQLPTLLLHWLHKPVQMQMHRPHKPNSKQKVSTEYIFF